MLTYVAMEALDTHHQKGPYSLQRTLCSRLPSECRGSAQHAPGVWVARAHEAQRRHLFIRKDRLLEAL